MENKFILTLDIGGTNPRIAMVEILDENNFKIIEKKNINKGEISIINPINNFLKQMGDKNITTNMCCICVAGVVKNNSCLNPPNAKFQILDVEILEKTYLEKVLVINDFESIGNAVSIMNIKNLIQSKKLFQIKSGVIDSNGNRAVIGAGTGLGVSYLINDKTKIKEQLNFIISASEGGHFQINELEETCGLINFLKKKYDSNSIGAEALVSGQGIRNIFEYLCLKNKSNEDVKILNILNDKNYDGAALIAKSKSKNSKKAMEFFIKYLAIASQNVALNGLSTGGLFIGGGIALKNLNLFENNYFVNLFNDNWRQSALLKKIPIYVILDYDISFYGCARAGIKKFN